MFSLKCEGKKEVWLLNLQMASSGVSFPLEFSQHCHQNGEMRNSFATLSKGNAYMIREFIKSSKDYLEERSNTPMKYSVLTGI